MDLQPLLNDIAGVSGNRVLPFAEYSKSGEISTARIPVTRVNANDKKDTVIRRFIRDYVKRQDDALAVDARFEDVGPGMAYRRDGKEYPVVGALIVTWWPRAPETEFEAIKRLQEERHKDVRGA